MNKNQRQLLAGGIAILVIALLIIFKKDVTPPAIVTADPILGCYVQTLEKDIYTLHIKTENSGMVTGELEFKNFEKDSSKGNFHGKYENEILLADYEFASEGLDSVRQVAFKKSGADFIEGFGPVEVVGGREAFIDTNDIVYDAKNTFVKTSDCTAPVVVKTAAYKNTSYKLGFRYPVNYYLKEKLDAGTPESSRLALVLALDTPENRAILDGTSTEVREEPISMNVDVYQNKEMLSAKDWIGKDTNWTVANSVTTRTDIAGLEALTFTWSGLYEGKTVIVTSGDKAYVFSVTWMNPEDAIKKDFETLLESVTLK